MSFEKDLAIYFPGALPQAEFFARSYDTLITRGFKYGNTIVGISVCPEEPACFLVEEIRKIWGRVVDLSRLGGMLFAGKTGFLSIRRYASQEEGDTFYLYMAFPHIGRTAKGEVGMYSSQEGASPFPSCSALVTFQEELASGSPCWELDPDDIEKGLLKQRLFRTIKYGDVPDLVTLTKLTYTFILEDLERLIGLTLLKPGGGYAVMTGIQINGPDQQNFIWPGKMYQVVHRKKTAITVS